MRAERPQLHRQVVHAAAEIPKAFRLEADREPPAAGRPVRYSDMVFLPSTRKLEMTRMMDALVAYLHA
jgi:hypothetical protein